MSTPPRSRTRLANSASRCATSAESRLGIIGVFLMSSKINRRTFTRTAAGALTALTAASASRVLGANERIRLGFIGVGNRGDQLLDAFMTHKDCEVAALCDVYQPYLDAARKKTDNNADAYGDYRKLLDRKDLDAVVIATPDHWHALQF